MIKMPIHLTKAYQQEENKKLSSAIKKAFEAGRLSRDKEILEIILEQPAIDGEDDDMLLGGVWIDRKELLNLLKNK